ncbi:MAG: DMT family transporter [Clostridia bacterium]|nr:DMT family transporter [Clostridia bacterium]
MVSYIQIVIADFLLTIAFLFQKKYQEKAGTSVNAGLIYTILSGVFSAVMFFVINGFTVRITLFSIIMSVLFSVAVTMYVFIGFRIMEKGNVSFYTLFLMSGGMVIPYIYGVLFLKEQLTLARVVGLVLILVAIISSNFTRGKFDKKQLFLCTMVFLLNGAVCVISKAHQISAASQIVSSSDFVILVAISKIVISLLVLPFNKDKSVDKPMVPFKSVILIVMMAAAADGIAYMLQLMGAVNLPATVLFPLITGGTIVLSTMMDFIFCKVKLSHKQWISVATAFLGTLMFL